MDERFDSGCSAANKFVSSVELALRLPVVGARGKDNEKLSRPIFGGDEAGVDRVGELGIRRGELGIQEEEGEGPMNSVGRVL